MRCEVERQSVVTQDAAPEVSLVKGIRYLFESDKSISVAKALVEQGLSSLGIQNLKFSLRLFWFRVTIHSSLIKLNYSHKLILLQILSALSLKIKSW